ncbi:DUF4202 domain-containing protein [Paraflavisolibacter sp. H34]|uniref:DUF4202 domain-containing protein n=1 Tax=Huijunlia imazamoxiresistens TaxID=3127457 RepID=UPI00301AF0A6
MSKLEKAFELFDAYNLQDPNSITWEGKDYPAEYFYALQLYKWIRKLAPQASEALLLASRAQHIGRWQSPREKYPMNKPGYYQWRTDLAKFHAEKAGELMHEAGYGDDQIREVQHIIRKEGLRTDAEVQAMENALCLVFLEFQYEDFLKKHDEQKMIRILQKSWNKMTQPGRDAALTLKFSTLGKKLVEKAILG